MGSCLVVYPWEFEASFGGGWMLFLMPNHWISFLEIAVPTHCQQTRDRNLFPLTCPYKVTVGILLQCWHSTLSPCEQSISIFSLNLLDNVSSQSVILSCLHLSLFTNPISSTNCLHGLAPDGTISNTIFSIQCPTVHVSKLYRSTLPFFTTSL